MPSPRQHLARIIQPLDNIAIPAALYAASITLGIGHILSIPLQTAAPLAAWTATAAWAAFLLDRVKPTDAWTEPADRTNAPQRTYFIERHAPRLRVLVLALTAVSTSLAALINPMLIPFTILGLAAVTVYHYPRPTTATAKPRRLKNHLLLKNTSVAAAFTALVPITLIAGTSLDTTSLTHSFTPAVRATIWTFLVVAADAALCDIGDEQGDAHDSTETLPRTIGRTPTITIAVIAHTIAAATIVTAAPTAPAHIAWLVIPAASIPLAARLTPHRLAPAIDLRLALTALAALLLALT